jgi:hypothetical protein
MTVATAQQFAGLATTFAHQLDRVRHCTASRFVRADWASST